jgi:hypothetical protein
MIGFFRGIVVPFLGNFKCHIKNMLKNNLDGRITERDWGIFGNLIEIIF